MFGDKLARDATDDVSAFLKRQKYDFLLGTKAAAADTAVEVDPTLLDRAFLSASPDARSAVFKQIGRDKAKYDDIARSYGLRDGNDYRTRGVKPERR